MDVHLDVDSRAIHAHATVQIFLRHSSTEVSLSAEVDELWSQHYVDQLLITDSWVFDSESEGGVQELLGGTVVQRADRLRIVWHSGSQHRL